MYQTPGGQTLAKVNPKSHTTTRTRFILKLAMVNGQDLERPKRRDLQRGRYIFTHARSHCFVCHIDHFSDFTRHPKNRVVCMCLCAFEQRRAIHVLKQPTKKCAMNGARLFFDWPLPLMDSRVDILACMVR